jgi:hypothetical protein
MSKKLTTSDKMFLMLDDLVGFLVWSMVQIADVREDE